MPEVLFACPIKNRAWTIPYWYNSILQQQDAADLFVTVVYTASDDDTLSLLEERGVKVLVDERPGRTDSEILGHLWNAKTHFAYMAEMRNRLIEYALDCQFEYLFSLDSDVLLPEGALGALLSFLQAHGGIVAPKLRMDLPIPNNQPQWNTMRFVDRAQPNFASSVRNGYDDHSADVIMAALLFDRQGMEARWLEHRQGEDIGLCIDAALKGIPRWWLDIECKHLHQKF